MITLEKTPTYNKCVNWMKEQIVNFGPQRLEDLTWNAPNFLKVPSIFLLHIISYGNDFVVNDGLVCLQDNSVKMISSSVPQDARPFSSGALKY